MATRIEEVALERFFAYFGVDLVFDVGANEGQYATMLRDRVGYRGPIVSFEPIPEVAERLRERARIDPLWHVEQVALSDQSGAAEFNITANSQFSSLKRPSTSSRADIDAMNSITDYITVPVERAEPYLREYRQRYAARRVHLKLDTQGSDVAVLRGVQDELRHLVGLQSELAFVRLYESAPNFAEALAHYATMGFKLSGIFPNNPGHFPDLYEMDCLLYRDVSMTASLLASGEATTP